MFKLELEMGEFCIIPKFQTMTKHRCYSFVNERQTTPHKQRQNYYIRARYDTQFSDLKVTSITKVNLQCRGHKRFAIKRYMQSNTKSAKPDE